MRKDINIPEVKNVTLAIARNINKLNETEWKVYLINNNNHEIENTLVTSKGYGKKDGKSQKTSVLRHYLETVPANSVALVEPIDPDLFHLANEFWVSYYIEREIFDKKFIFLPETIKEENLIYIKQLNSEGVLHS